MSADSNIESYATRRERDADRIYAGQIMDYLLNPEARLCNPTIFPDERKAAMTERLWQELHRIAGKLAEDYRVNTQRAWDEDEFNRLTDIASIAANKQDEEEQLAELKQALLRKAELAQLMAGTANNVYALMVGATKILNYLPALASSMGCSAHSSLGLDMALSTMGQIQPYFAISLQTFLLLFEMGVLIKHRNKLEVQQKNGETVAAKLLQHGRWQRYANSGLWLASGISVAVLKATLVGSTVTVPVMSVVGATIFISGLIQFVRQAVELKKLIQQRDQYRERIHTLHQELLPYVDHANLPEEQNRLSVEEVNQKQAEYDSLLIFRNQLNEKIADVQGALVRTLHMPTLSMAAMAITAIGLVTGVMPLALFGSLLLFTLAMVTLVMNGRRIHQMAKAIRAQSTNRPRSSADAASLSSLSSSVLRSREHSTTSRPPEAVKSTGGSVFEARAMMAMR